MSLKTVLAAAGLVALAAAPALATAETADEKAIKDLVRAFSAAYSTMDASKLAKLYTDDAQYFHRTGHYVYGKKQIADFMLAPEEEAPATEGGAGGAAPPGYKIVIEAVDAIGSLGYVYGRVCDAGPKEPPSAVVEDLKRSGPSDGCHTRWFLVTKKGADGKWLIHSDLDLDYKACSMPTTVCTPKQKK